MSGGSIGTGLFVGSGAALNRGGPAGVLIAWILIGIMLINVTQVRYTRPVSREKPSHPSLLGYRRNVHPLPRFRWFLYARRPLLGSIICICDGMELRYAMGCHLTSGDRRRWANGTVLGSRRSAIVSVDYNILDCHQ